MNVRLTALSLIIISFASAVAQQSNRTVAKIEVEGLTRLSAAEVVATSGLKTGTPLSVPELDAAGQKLFDSGLFSKVAYRTTSKGNQVTVIFQVEEVSGGQSPVVFDNFVWFTRDELITAIRGEVPSFNGMAADAGRMTDDIKRALETLLRERKLEGSVEYLPEQSLGGVTRGHVFSVSGVPIPICSLHFPGASNVSENKLVKSSKQLTDADYSQTGAIAISTFTLLPLYSEVGQLRAKFSEPTVLLSTADNCKGGVDVTIPVVEGPIFLLDKTAWNGNNALTATQLNEALAMKPGDLANGVKFKKGLHEAEKIYGAHGYLEASLKAQPAFDDENRRVDYTIAVKEGPQYRMGTLTITGVTEAEAQSLQGAWKLRSGDIFDESYFSRFFIQDARQEMQRIMSRRKAGFQPNVKTTPHRETLTADVTLEFKAVP
jgi:outer membrane protein insertion porin family